MPGSRQTLRRTENDLLRLSRKVDPGKVLKHPSQVGSLDCSQAQAGKYISSSVPTLVRCEAYSTEFRVFLKAQFERKYGH